MGGGVIRTSLGSVATACKLGSILSGPIRDKKFSNVTTSACATRAPLTTKSMTNVMTIDLKPDEITKSLNKFWDTESLGVVKEEFLKPNEVRMMELDMKLSYHGKRNTLIFQVIIY